MTAPLPRNACPSLAAPMLTGDGLLVRLNTLSGGMSPEALAKIAASAARHGNGILEVTRRGSLQIRGLSAESAIALSGDIENIGLDIRTGVPVETGPLAGLDPHEISDPRPLVGRIRRLVAAEGLSAKLGPKVSVVVDGGGHILLDDVLADVRVNALAPSKDGPAWRVAVGGTAAMAQVIGIFDERSAATAVLQTLRAIASLGRGARGKDLSPAAAGISVTEYQLSPVILEDGTEAQIQVPGKRHDKSIGVIPLGSNLCTLGIMLPFGQTSSDQLAALAAAASGLGVSDIKLAPNRTVLAICSDANTAAALRAAASQLGFVTRADDPRLSVIACAGAPACASGHIQTKAIAAGIAATLAQSDRTPIVHVSGCEKRCAEPARSDFTILGVAGGCRIICGSAQSARELACVAEGGAVGAFQRAAGLKASHKKIVAAPGAPSRIARAS